MLLTLNISILTPIFPARSRLYSVQNILPTTFILLPGFFFVILWRLANKVYLYYCYILDWSVKRNTIVKIIIIIRRRRILKKSVKIIVIFYLFIFYNNTHLVLGISKFSVFLNIHKRDLSRPFPGAVGTHAQYMQGRPNKKSQYFLVTLLLMLVRG